jgi:hypothetical protein
MSRTKRKDPLDIRRKRPDFIFMGQVISMKPTKKELRQAHADGKKHCKPSSSFKKMTAAQRKAKARQALRNMKDPDELIVPEPPKTDQWDWS